MSEITKKTLIKQKFVVAKNNTGKKKPPPAKFTGRG